MVNISRGRGYNRLESEGFTAQTHPPQQSDNLVLQAFRDLRPLSPAATAARFIGHIAAIPLEVPLGVAKAINRTTLCHSSAEWGLNADTGPQRGDSLYMQSERWSDHPYNCNENLTHNVRDNIFHVPLVPFTAAYAVTIGAVRAWLPHLQGIANANTMLERANLKLEKRAAKDFAHLLLSIPREQQSISKDGHVLAHQDGVTDVIDVTSAIENAQNHDYKTVKFHSDTKTEHCVLSKKNHNQTNLISIPDTSKMSEDDKVSVAFDVLKFCKIFPKIVKII